MNWKKKCDGIVVTAREYFCEAADANIVSAAERLIGFCGIARRNASVKQVEETKGIDTAAGGGYGFRLAPVTGRTAEN